MTLAILIVVIWFLTIGIYKFTIFSPAKEPP